MISKAELIKQIQKFPEEIAIEDLVERLILIDKLEKRIAESKDGQNISEEDLKKEMQEWFR
ncbi:hypothetical protein J0A68_09165 [Algoriphagus sp. H41]|uniref:Addiction module component n=1 Tax=Algoriphagus oliviformis TaxID=2811231 RepID=A0ABS3C2K6_9BACT|nr:hypothetical protein [Algoriphagus oliviformis]MBN7811125.1 hypothetical protein [Algoriphagus oliviformis]